MKSEIGANKPEKEEVAGKPVNFLLIAFLSINVKGTAVPKVSQSNTIPGKL